MLHGSDVALVRRLLAGREEAFEEFCSTYFPRLCRFALARLDNDADRSLDVAQTTVSRAIANLETYRGEAPLASWLFAICRHEIFAHYRRSKRRPVASGLLDDLEVVATLDSLQAEHGQPEVELQRKELARSVHVTLDHLPQRYSNALEWKYIEGLSVKQIAERLQIGPKAAESLLTRARQAFREGFSAATAGGGRAHG